MPLNFFAEKGNLKRSRSLFSRLTDSFGLFSNVVTLSILLKSYAYAVKPEIADALLSELVWAGASLNQVLTVD